MEYILVGREGEYVTRQKRLRQHLLRNQLTVDWKLKDCCTDGSTVDEIKGRSKPARELQYFYCPEWFRSGLSLGGVHQLVA